MSPETSQGAQDKALSVTQLGKRTLAEIEIEIERFFVFSKRERESERISVNLCVRLILDRVLLKIYSWVIGRGREIQCGPFDEDQ